MALIQSGSSANLMDVNAAKQAFVTTTTRTRLGVYACTTGLLSVQAAAQAAGVGLFWIVNPLGNSRAAAIRRIEFDCIGVGLAAALTRMGVERFTFTGTASGAQIAAGKIDSQHASPSILTLTASTGLTITPGATLYTFFCMSVITAAGIAEPVVSEWEPNEEAMVVLRAGEGLMFRQPDAGVASDPRRFTVNFAWEEF